MSFHLKSHLAVRMIAFVAIINAFHAALLRAEDAGNHDKNSKQWLTVERIYEGSDFNAKGYSVQWTDDGTAFWRWESAASGGGQDLVRVDALTGDAEVVVEAKDFVPSGTNQPLDIDNYAWSTTRHALLLFTDAERVWRYATRGNYWVLDRATKLLRQLGGDAPAKSLMFAKFSPDGQRVAYVRDRNIYLEDLRSGRIQRITETPTEEIINGTFDWVYEEELQLRDGFRWSPSGHAIAFWQIDTTDVPTFTMLNNTDTLYPEAITFAYPKTGQLNPKCRLGVFYLDTGETRWVEPPGDSRDHYICRMTWRGDDAIVFQQLNRLQNTNKVYRVDTSSGQMDVLWVESDEAWVDVHDEMQWTKDGSLVTWISERDGWRHLYRFSSSGEFVNCVTPFAMDVIGLLKYDESENWIYFLASPDNATQQYLYRVRPNGEHLSRVTPPSLEGTHSYQMAPEGDLAIHRWSRFGEPSKAELIRLEGHETLRTLEENKPVRKALKKLARCKHEFFQVKLDDETTLDGWCIFPHGFDANKKYPLLVYVYGEPAGTTVVDRWGGSTYLWHYMLAQRGYLVMSFDNRGTPAPKGREWRKTVYRKIGILAPQDQANALRTVLKERPYIDATRVGIWGWSGGGSMSLNAIFKYPELYRTAVSIAPVPNMRYYDTIYQERYMGLPSDNVDGYMQGSPIHFAKNLEGNLLVIHGTGDDNCHYQTTEALIDELIRHGKQFSMMAYPNRTHAIRERQGTTPHLRHLMTDYLARNLPSESGEAQAQPASNDSDGGPSRE